MSEFGRMYKNALTWGVLAAGLLFRGALAAMDALYRGGSFWQRAAGFWDGTGSVALSALVLLVLIHVFSADRETGVEELVLTTPFGRGRLFARRIAAAALAAATGCPVHICHVSTAGSVALMRDARRRGVRVTAETAPHYFALTEECLRSRDADYRMNPPLRTEQDVQAVIEGLRDGTLTVIATDHAPHSAEDKADFLTAPNGVVGLETSLAAGITYLVKPGYLTLRRLLELMAAEPARILGIPGGVLEVGGPADLMVFDPHEEWTVRPERLHSKSKNSAFKGMALTGRVKATVCRGDVVYRDV